MTNIELIDYLAFVKCERMTNKDNVTYNISGKLYSLMLDKIEKLSNECLRLKEEKKEKVIIKYRGSG